MKQKVENNTTIRKYNKIERSNFNWDTVAQDGR